MLQRSSITLLRIPFSFFLMPVYFFALSQVKTIDVWKALLVFIVLHFIMYPASNGYNSYMDRDEQSIGMLAHPPKPTRELFYLTIVLDTLAILLSFLVNIIFASCIIANIAASHAYSYRKIRLKKYPIIGFCTVVFFQGALTYFMVFQGANAAYKDVPWMGMLISTFLFGGFYPLTQIYQHAQDLQDGVKTISYKLGLQGTFIFSGCMYLIAEGLLYYYFKTAERPSHFYFLQFFFAPVVAYFFFWWKKVRRDSANANFKYSMRMNTIAALCMNIAFVALLIQQHAGK